MAGAVEELNTASKLEANKQKSNEKK